MRTNSSPILECPYQNQRSHDDNLMNQPPSVTSASTVIRRILELCYLASFLPIPSCLGRWLMV